MINISFGNKSFCVESDITVVFLDENMKIEDSIKSFDKENGGLLGAFVNSDSSFKGKFGSMKTITLNFKNELKHLLLVGIGKKEDLKDYKIEDLGSKILNKINMLKLKSASVFMDYIDFESVADKNCLLAIGMKISSYRFNDYFTEMKEEDKPSLQKVEIVSSNYSRSKNLFESYYDHVVKGVYFAKDCTTEPPNVIYPQSYADRIFDVFSGLQNVKVKVLGEYEMKSLGMGALLGVGQGSEKESKMVIIEYSGSKDSSKKPIALVGKGVCFDTGGISIKPADGMWDMKYDMAGSAAVVGSMLSLVSRKASVNAVGVVGLVENMPDGKAQRPGDVVKSASGKTIEVLNTDAEGRLVLADALWYVQENFKPELIIDLATLTGAIIVSLGTAYAGTFSNNDDLADNLRKSGLEVMEKVWRLPLDEVYEKMIKSEIADVANISTSGKGAGSSTAAHFLQKFVNKDIPWAHIDIAGVAWAKTPSHLCNKGATAFGVRLLDRMVKDYYEDK